MRWQTSKQGGVQEGLQSIMCKGMSCAGVRKYPTDPKLSRPMNTIPKPDLKVPPAVGAVRTCPEATSIRGVNRVRILSLLGSLLAFSTPFTAAQFPIQDSFSGPNFHSIDIRDSDGDGLLNYQEPTYGTDPNNPDTDGDKLSDGEEALNLSTDPLVFTNWITSDLSQVKLKYGKPMRVYRILTNINAKQFTAQGLPPGLKLNEKSGVVSGSPTKKGLFMVKLKATKNTKISVSGVLTIKVF